MNLCVTWLSDEAMSNNSANVLLAYIALCTRAQGLHELYTAIV